MSFNVKQVISMPFEWTQNLSIGVAEIDNQHKELFKRINNLLDAISQGKGKQELFAVLEFLEDYSKFHFAKEEKLMLAHHYSAYKVHKAEHERFIQELNGLKKKFETAGASLALVVEVQRKTIDWLIEHISKIDKQMANMMHGLPKERQ